MSVENSPDAASGFELVDRENARTPRALIHGRHLVHSEAGILAAHCPYALPDDSRSYRSWSTLGGIRIHH